MMYHLKLSSPKLNFDIILLEGDGHIHIHINKVRAQLIKILLLQIFSSLLLCVRKCADHLPTEILCVLKTTRTTSNPLPPTKLHAYLCALKDVISCMSDINSLCLRFQPFTTMAIWEVKDV